MADVVGVFVYFVTDIRTHLGILTVKLFIQSSN